MQSQMCSKTLTDCRAQSVWPSKYGGSTMRIYLKRATLVFNSFFLTPNGFCHRDRNSKLLSQFVRLVCRARYEAAVPERLAGREGKIVLLSAAAAAAAAGRRLLFTGRQEEEQLPLRARGNTGSLAVYLIQFFFFRYY